MGMDVKLEYKYNVKDFGAIDVYKRQGFKLGAKWKRIRN